MRRLEILLRAVYIYWESVGYRTLTEGMINEFLYLYSFTPQMQSISLFTYCDLSLSPLPRSLPSLSLSAVNLSYFAHFISISIFSFYLWTPLSELF